MRMATPIVIAIPNRRLPMLFKSAFARIPLGRCRPNRNSNVVAKKVCAHAQFPTISTLSDQLLRCDIRLLSTVVSASPLTPHCIPKRTTGRLRKTGESVFFRQTHCLTRTLRRPNDGRSVMGITQRTVTNVALQAQPPNNLRYPPANRSSSTCRLLG